MPSPNSPSWADRFEYHLQQSLLALGGTVTLNEQTEPSWHNRIEALLKGIATNIGNGGELPDNVLTSDDIGVTVQLNSSYLNAINNLGEDPAGLLNFVNASTVTLIDPNTLGGSTPQQSSNSYYTYLASLNPQILVGLEDWTSNVVFDRNNTQVGFLSGNFAQQRPSLLSDANARSTLFRTGAALLDGLPRINSDISSATVVCRFRARADATGVLFSYGNTADFNPSTYDRVVYLNGNNLSVYGFDNALTQAVNLDSAVNVRDNLPHTLVVRISPMGTDLWLDNTRIINDPRQIKADYNGFWRIGHGLIFGPRSSFGGFARGINIAGFATFNRLLLELTELPGIHNNA